MNIYLEVKDNKFMKFITYFIIVNIIFLTITNCQNESQNKNQKNNTLTFQNIIFPNGYYILKHRNGNIAISGTIIDGELNGVWKLFDSEGLLKNAIYFYKGDKIVDIDETDYCMHKIKLGNANISINIPEKWNVKQDKEPLILVATKEHSKNKVFTPLVSIEKTNMPKCQTFDKFIDENINILLNHYSDIQINEKKLDLGSHLNSFEITYTVKLNDIIIAGFIVIFNKETDIYTITCVSEGINNEFMKYKDLFTEIAYSLSLNE